MDANRYSYFQTGSSAAVSLFAGLIAATAMVLMLDRSVAMAGALTVAIPAALLLVFRPKWLVLLLLFLIMVLEEFPSGEGETVERSLRMPFYATSLGVPGLYAPDLLLFGALSLFLIGIMVRRIPLLLPDDAIFKSLAAIAFVFVFAAIFSVVAGNPLSDFRMPRDAQLYEMNERGAKFVTVFHLKNFSYLFFAYLLGLFYFQDRIDLQRLLQVWWFAILVSIMIGLVRLGLSPSLITEGRPLFYHSPTTWIFALTVFYWVLNWAYGRIGLGKLLLWAGLSVILSIFILISFRRTMWGGIALTAFLLTMMLSGRVRQRYSVLLGIGLSLGMLAVIAVPGALQSVLARISETSADDLSTLYRLSLFVWFANNYNDIPFFGYGIRPLWDVEARLGFFRMNLENIHSIYFWVLLRTGFVGFMICTVAIVMIIRQLWRTVKDRSFVAHQPLILSIFAALIIYLFSGIFNPVYAEVRYLVLIGFALALVSRLPRLQETQT